jgi:cephalosporin-C deacetylase-like acetyl esterase
MNALLKLLIICLFVSSSVYGQISLTENDLTVLDEPADTMMRSYLTGIVDRQFAERESMLSAFKTESDWNKWINTIRDSVRSWTGPLPERTPLNARVTKRIDKGDYIIENIIYESRPDYYVSGNLYLPKEISGRRPAHLNVIGHAADGKASSHYQRMSIAQAKNGFVVFTIDQLGQGERQVEEYQSWGGAPGNAHRIIGIQAFISGTHVFNIMVWDAIRAIDFLVGRPEVDPGKICMTGSSGGGMMTTYILPLDNRIAVAVPTCNPNTWSYRVHANLSTDHEQVFFGAFESKIDPRGDLLFTQVPKPLLLNTTTDDNLNPPRGVWDLSNWLYKLYSVYKVPEKFTTSMVKAAHDYNQEQREVTYSWMLRWTGNDASNLWEEDVNIERKDVLYSAERGSVFNEPDSRSDHDLVLEYLAANKAEWEAVKNSKGLEKLKTEMKPLVKQILHTDFRNLNTACKFKDEQNTVGVKIRKFVLNPEAGIILPGVLIEPSVNSNTGKYILYINEKGKNSLKDDRDIVADLISNGYSVCAVDLRGIGETSPDMAGKFWDFLAGKPIFGQRVKDVMTIVNWLKDSDVGAEEIKLWGTGMCALYGSFAGVVTDDISGFVLEQPLISFESIVRVEIPAYNHEILLPGILEKFDMTQIYQSLCPRKVSVINPLTGNKNIVGNTDIEQIEKAVSLTYKALKKSGTWSMVTSEGAARADLIVKTFTVQ